jgi:anti-anti-sigma factor
MDERVGEIAFSVNDGIATVSLTGEVDMGSGDALERDIAVMVERNHPKGLVVDLSRADFIDSSVLGVLMLAVRRHAVRTAVVAPSEGAVRTLLETIDANTIVPVFNSRADALKMVAAAQA